MISGPSPFHYCFWLQDFGHECGRVGGILHTPEPYLQPSAAALILVGVFLGFTTLFATVWFMGTREK